MQSARGGSKVVQFHLTATKPLRTGGPWETTLKKSTLIPPFSSSPPFKQLCSNVGKVLGWQEGCWFEVAVSPRVVRQVGMVDRVGLKRVINGSKTGQKRVRNGSKAGENLISTRFCPISTRFRPNSDPVSTHPFGFETSTKIATGAGPTPTRACNTGPRHKRHRVLVGHFLTLRTLLGLRRGTLGTDLHLKGSRKFKPARAGEIARSGWWFVLEGCTEQGSRAL